MTINTVDWVVGFKVDGRKLYRYYLEHDPCFKILVQEQCLLPDIFDEFVLYFDSDGSDNDKFNDMIIDTMGELKGRFFSDSNLIVYRLTHDVDDEESFILGIAFSEIDLHITECDIDDIEDIITVTDAFEQVRHHVSRSSVLTRLKDNPYKVFVVFDDCRCCS